LATIFEAGQESGDNFVVSLNNMIERWDGFLESTEGQTALADFFETGKEVADAFKPVLDGLKEAFDVLVTDDSLANLQSLGEALGQAVPAFAQILELTGQLQLMEAVAEIVTVLGQLADLINNIPDPLLEMAGAFLVVNAAMGRMSPLIVNGIKGIKGLSDAFKGVGTAVSTVTKVNIALAALSLAFTAGMAIYDSFTANQRKADEATKDFTNTLADQVDMIITSGDIVAGADVAYRAFSQTATEFDKDGKAQRALGFLNKDMGDFRSTVMAIDADAKSALGGLATSYGLPIGPAQRLAEIVDSTDENFQESSAYTKEMEGDLKAVAEAAGLPYPVILKIAQAMEEMQDQAENLDLDESTQELLDNAKGASLVEQASLKMAQANQEAGLVAEGTGALYDEYTRLLNENANMSDDAARAALGQVSSVTLVQQAIDDAIAAHKAHEEALKKEKQAAYDAWREQEQLASKTEDAAVSIAGAMGFSEDLADELVDLGEAARGAAEAASDFMAVIELLISPTANLASTNRDIEQGFDDITEALQGGQEAIDLRKEALERMNEAAGESDPERAAQLRDEAAAANEEAAALERAAISLDIHTEAGRANAELLAGQAELYLQAAAGMIETGESAEAVAAKLDEGRAALQLQAEAFGLTTADAQAYVDVLLGTPEFINTLVQTPGLFEALLNAEDLTLLYDAAGNPVITEFEALGLDPALANSQSFKDLLDQLNIIHATPTVDASGAVIAEDTFDSTATAVQTLDEATAEPTVAVDEKGDPIGKVDTLQGGLDTLEQTNPSPNITLPGINTRITEVRNLQSAINSLRSKTITITVNQRVTGQTLPGGIRVPRSMAGEIITQPGLRHVGERGYREAIVPLDLPLNRVNPEVRQLAALLRGEGTTLKLAGGKTVNNYLNVTPISADPEAIATKVINRAAAMAIGN